MNCKKYALLQKFVLLKNFVVGEMLEYSLQ